MNNSSKPRRVIVWGTGTLGRVGLRLVIEHPELELVGLHAWSDEKQGKDAGEVAGLDIRTGVIATNDCNALLALRADCIAHFPSSVGREEQLVDELVPFLRAGTNVVTHSLMDLFQPKYGRPEIVEPIRAACEAGNSSVFSTGVDPGYCTTGFALNAMALAGRIDEVHLMEIDELSQYGGVESMRLYGFGQPLDYKPPMFTDGIGEVWHVSTVRCMADYLGIEIDHIDSRWETAAVDFDVEAIYGRLPAGSTMATRWTLTAYSNNRPFIIYKKLIRLHPKAAPQWEQGQVGEGNEAFWRINIVGEPSYQTEMGVKLLPGLALTPAHPVNAIPTVCEAPAGILDPLSLKPFFSTTVHPALKRKERKRY